MSHRQHLSDGEHSLSVEPAEESSRSPTSMPAARVHSGPHLRQRVPGSSSSRSAESLTLRRNRLRSRTRMSQSQVRPLPAPESQSSAAESHSTHMTSSCSTCSSEWEMQERPSVRAMSLRSQQAPTETHTTSSWTTAQYPGESMRTSPCQEREEQVLRMRHTM